MSNRYTSLLLAACLTVTCAIPALAQPHDTPTITLESVGPAKMTLRVTAGPSGAPDGFSLYWMTAVDYEDYGNVWPTSLSYPGLHWASFTGVPTLNTFDGAYSSFQLGPNESILVEIGDLADETGVTTNTLEELPYEENYVVCSFANAGPGGGRSGYSLNATGTTDSKQDCVHSQGYWKNHASQWPVTSLMLGTVLYNQAQLLSILNQPTAGNGLVSMSRQLIAAKLNIANGAQPQAIVLTTIAAADAQIGALVVPPVGGGFLSPASTSPKTQKLDDFNSGGKYNDGCDGTTSATPTTWGRMKALYR